MSDGAVIAARILESDGEPFATLSLANGLPPVTISTAIADARRNYMRLAALIHPDKIKGEFEKSTEAFQCLVKAFETFVDPKLRKRAAAVLEKSKKKGTGEVKATTEKKQKDKIDKQKRKAKHKVDSSEKTEIAKHDKSAEVTKRKKKTKEEQQEEEDEDDFVEKDSEEESESDEDEDEDESQAGEEGEDWEDKFLADDIEPAVSTSRTPIGVARVGGVYTQTIIGCPNCRTRWEPDSKPQYSLFMGKWGKKVHCQLCLFVFGSASALHNCPHCDSAFDYDASMYDSTITCAGCKREIGFPYYPVNQMLIDNLALEQWRARKEAEKIKERELRARQRHGLGATDHNTFRSSGSSKGNNNKSSSSSKTQRADENEEEMLTLVGTCVVEDECPLCHQRIKRNHRTHVEECIKLTPEQRKEAKRTRKATMNDNISGNQQNSKKETVSSTRKRARLSTTQTKESEDSVNDIKAKNTKVKAKQPAKVPSLSTSSSSTAKGSKSGNKQPNSRQRRRGKRNHSDDDDDESEEEESFSDDDSEDNDESDEEDEFTESDDEDDDDYDDE